MNGVLNLVEKQKLFNDFMDLLTSIGKLSPAEQIRETLKVEQYLADIYKKGYDVGFEVGKENAIDILKK